MRRLTIAAGIIVALGSLQPAAARDVTGFAAQLDGKRCLESAAAGVARAGQTGSQTYPDDQCRMQL